MEERPQRANDTRRLHCNVTADGHPHRCALRLSGPRAAAAAAGLPTRLRTARPRARPRPGTTPAAGIGSAPPRPARRRQRLRPAADAQRPEPWPSAACWGCWPPPRCWAQVGRGGIGRRGAPRRGRSAVAAAPGPGAVAAPGLGRNGGRTPAFPLPGPGGTRESRSRRLRGSLRGRGEPGWCRRAARSARGNPRPFFGGRYQCKAYRKSRFLIPETSYSKRLFLFLLLHCSFK